MVNPCDDTLLTLAAVFILGACAGWISGFIGGYVMGMLERRAQKARLGLVKRLTGQKNPVSDAAIKKEKKP